MPGSDDFLRIGASFDVGALQAGMSQGASAVAGGTEEMAAGFDRVATASEEAEAKIRGGMKGAEYSVTEARHALHGLGEEMGVHVPRFVQSFVAEMGGVGPALSSAFSAIAIVGLIQVLAEIPDAIDEIVEKLSGWTKAEQEAYDATLKANNARRDLLDQVTVEQARIAGIGKDEMGKQVADQNALNIEIAQTKQRLEEVQRLNAQLRSAEQGVTTSYGPTEQEPAGGTVTERTLPPMMKNWEEVKKKIEETQSEADKLRNKLTELSQVKAPTVHADMLEAARKDLELINQEHEKEGKEQEEAAVRRGNAQREAADKAEQMMVENEKSTREAAQKDLEDFQKTQSEKARLSDELGKQQLEDIRANAAEQERLIQKQAGKGGSTGALVGVAASSLSQQEDLIANLITKEEELRATQLDANDPKDREAWNASLQREQALVQELNVAWKNYEKTVQDQAERMRETFQQTMTGIGASFNQGFIAWANRQETFGRAMENSWTHIGDNAISNLLKISEQMAINALLGRALVSSEKSDAATVAAAWMFAQAVKIPVVGPFVAEPMALAAYAAVLSFDQGGIMPNDNMAMLHKNEMVLDPKLSGFVQDAAAKSSGQAGGDTHVHFSPQINAIDGASVQDMLNQHEKVFARVMLKHLRRNGYR